MVYRHTKVPMPISSISLVTIIKMRNKKIFSQPPYYYFTFYRNISPNKSLLIFLMTITIHHFRSLNYVLIVLLQPQLRSYNRFYY